MQKQASWKREKAFKLIIARYFVKHWKCFLCVPPLPFAFLSSPQTHKEPAKQLSRLGLALSNEHRFSFIAQTFTILFAMYQPTVWQRLPLYHRDIFWLFFSFWRLQCCILEGGYMKDKFHSVPTTIMALLFGWGGGFFAGPCQEKRWKWENKLIACYTKPARHMPVFAVFSSATV